MFIKDKRPPVDIAPRIAIKLHDHYRLPYGSDDEVQKYFLEHNIIDWKLLCDKYPGISISRAFTSLNEDEIWQLVEKVKRISPKYQPTNFCTYFVINCPYETGEEELLSSLTEDIAIEEAYLETDSFQPPAVTEVRNPINLSQGYLDEAPNGIDANFARTVRNTLGADTVRFIDIEQGWVLDHEDLAPTNINLVWGKNDDFKDHGTAVLGIILMQENDRGGIGIAPWVKADVISQIKESGVHAIADAILKATDELNFGDVLLLEIQVNTSRRSVAYWPAEIKRAIFDVINLAVAKGIIVIEPAGNGENGVGNKLDDFKDRGGKDILNPSSQHFRESGAIMVAAASSNPEHGKMQSSNFGDRINCFAWGDNVATTGYNPTEATNSYIDDFDGTSSASAIIAGAAIAVQSIIEASGKSKIGPFRMREILSDKRNGTDSRNNIGVMPDLKIIINTVIPLLP